MELWDAYDDNFNVIPGRALVRGKPIADGMYHLACDILVKHADGTYLLMQRYFRKMHGGMWEASAGGSALQGETPLECARRELKEETGLAETNLIELGRVIHHRNHTLYVEYMVVTDCDKDSVKLQEGETQAYKWVSGETIRDMNSAELVTRRMQVFVPEIQ